MAVLFIANAVTVFVTAIGVAQMVADNNAGEAVACCWMACICAVNAVTIFLTVK
jgi:hypothetical protein